MVAVSRNTCISISTPLPLKNIYYLLSLIHYLLSEVPGCANGFCPSAPQGYFCQSSQNEALKVRIIWGLLRRIFTVTALKMLAMEQPLLCFSPCHSKNTTQNSLINPNFQRLPKKTLFFIRRKRESKWRLCGGKAVISLPLRLQLSCAEPPLPSDAAFICKQERRVGINLYCKNI